MFCGVFKNIAGIAVNASSRWRKKITNVCESRAKNEYASGLIKWKAECFSRPPCTQTEGVIRPTSLASHSDCQTPLYSSLSQRTSTMSSGVILCSISHCAAPNHHSSCPHLRQAECVCGVHWRRKTPPDCLLRLDVMLPDLHTSFL
jgi:hypothetical protein